MQAELQAELDELLVTVAAETSVFDQTMGNLKAMEESVAALRKKCSDADALLEKKTQQVACDRLLLLLLLPPPPPLLLLLLLLLT